MVVDDIIDSLHTQPDMPCHFDGTRLSGRWLVGSHDTIRAVECPVGLPGPPQAPRLILQLDNGLIWASVKKQELRCPISYCCTINVASVVKCVAWTPSVFMYVDYYVYDLHLSRRYSHQGVAQVDHGVDQ